VSNSYSGPGTGGANALPLAVCGLGHLRSGGIGRSGRGRAYLPFPSTAFATPATSEPTAAYITAATTLLENLATIEEFGSGGNVADVDLIVFNRNAAFAGGNPGPAVTTWNVSPLWATQHRRGDFGRTNNTANPLPA
jgi:hypothetical protein